MTAGIGLRAEEIGFEVHTKFGLTIFEDHAVKIPQSR